MFTMIALIVSLVVLVSANDAHAAYKRAHELVSTDMDSAIRYFEKAIELNPSNSQYHNDLGVSYLRQQQFRKCYAVLSSGLSIDPTSSSLRENLKSLRTNLILMGRVGLLRELFSEVKDDQSGEYVPVTKDEPSSGDFRRRTTTIHLDEAVMETNPVLHPVLVMAKDVTAPLVRKWLGDWFWNPQIRQNLTSSISSASPYEIPGFLRTDKADAVYSEMYNLSPSYKLREGFSENYQFHIHTLYESSDTEYIDNFHISQLHEIMNSALVRGMISELARSSTRLTESTISSVSYYKANDYTTLHSDHYTHEEGFRREVAFVLHMTKDWDVSMGGDLLYLNPLRVIHPKFNNMVLFKVLEDSWHMVTPVSYKVPSEIKRLAYNGWWTSSSNS